MRCRVFGLQGRALVGCWSGFIDQILSNEDLHPMISLWRSGLLSPVPLQHGGDHPVHDGGDSMTDYGLHSPGGGLTLVSW